MGAGVLKAACARSKLQVVVMVVVHMGRDTRREKKTRAEEIARANSEPRTRANTCTGHEARGNARKSQPCGLAYGLRQSDLLLRHL